ncbi:MAG: flagellar hook capping FlgD N-terminal domain-containing protein [Rubricoccaceae bacterium]
MSPLTPASSTDLSPQAAASLAGSTGNAALGRDEFLQLLVAQLRNQDPSSPQQGHEFAAQLAQFSSVEQLTNIGSAMASQSDQLTALASALEGIQAGQATMADQLSGRIDLQAASSLVGQTVEVASGAIDWTGSGDVPLQVRLDEEVREVSITIRDASGTAIRTIRAGTHSAGDHAFSWDGALDDGSPAPEGAYTADVTAVGADGTPASATPFTRGTVDRLTVESGGVRLWIGDQPVPFDALLSVRSNSTASASTASGPMDLRTLVSSRSAFLPMP